MNYECWLITKDERDLILELLRIGGSRYRNLEKDLSKRKSQNGYYIPFPKTEEKQWNVTDAKRT